MQAPHREGREGRRALRRVQLPRIGAGGREGEAPVEGGGGGGGGRHHILRAREALGDVGRARARRQMDREANGLLPEISRLARTKRESAALLGVMANQHSCSSSKTAPLRLQVRRLEQELDAVSSQSNYLDGELSNRNNEIASLKRNHSRRSVLCARSWTAPGWRWSAPSGTLRRRASSTTERPATSSDRRGGYATLS